MTAIPMMRARKRLSMVWFCFGGVLFAVLFIQTLANPYLYKDVSEPWSWFLPNIVPTLSLMIGVLVAEAMGKGSPAKSVDAFMYRLGLAASLIYLVCVAAVIFYGPVSGQAPFELMKKSSLALGPMQGLVSGVLVLFFARKSE